jgi:hypothetical protein
MMQTRRPNKTSVPYCTYPYKRRTMTPAHPSGYQERYLFQMFSKTEVISKVIQKNIKKSALMR